MKKIFTLLVIAFSLKAVCTKAQNIPNSGFNQLNSNGSLRNWGNVYLVPFTLDTNGNYVTDSIVYDNQYYAPTADANSGTHALELRNAWNFTSNTGIAGAVASDDDSIFSAWGLMNLVPTNATVWTPFSPFNFSFYYKYSPVNGDSAFAQIALWDSSGNQIAEGTAIITAAASSYTQIITSIDYNQPTGYAAFYSMQFSTFYTTSPGSHSASFGTRFLVDDISFNNVSISGINSIGNNSNNKIYPNPASDQINITSNVNKALPYKIFNVFGQIVSAGILQPYTYSIGLNNLQPGIFHIEISNGNVVEQHSFIKR